MLRNILMRPPNRRGANWILILIGLYNLYRGMAIDPIYLFLGVGLLAIGAAELLPEDQLTTAAVLRVVGLVAVLVFLPLLVVRFVG